MIDRYCFRLMNMVPGMSDADLLKDVSVNDSCTNGFTSTADEAYEVLRSFTPSN
jgi:hypothetical protein